MTVLFDDGAAEALITAATGAANSLRSQGAGRRAAAEAAAAQFAGAYARLFEAMCTVEAEDRLRLAGVLDEVSRTVTDAQQQASAEKQRISLLAAWQEREDQRIRDHALSSAPVTPFAGAFDPKPSEVAIQPPSLSASYAARERNRTAAGSAGGSSSADPEQLRQYVAQVSPLNAALTDKSSTLSSAWTGFQSACSWVPIDGGTVVTGFARYLSENSSDADWIEKIAAAFELAGGAGTLPSAGKIQAVLSDVAIGTAVALMERYRGGLIIPGDKAAQLAPFFEAADARWEKQVISGVTYSVRPGDGFLIPSGSLPPKTVPPAVIKHPEGWRHTHHLSPLPGVGTPPTWMRLGGRGLGVAGYGLTLWGTYADSYNSTLESHPDWGENERQQRAVEDTVIVGGNSVAGAAGGAWAGAAIGASIGSIFPGPGTLIGGILGGVIGGVIGGMAGQRGGEALVNHVRGEA